MGSKKKKVTVGYRYSWDLFCGLGRGPIDSIVAITADKKIVWLGKEGEANTNCSIYINKPNLFGGEDTGGEGGIQGNLEIMMGEPNQTPSNSLKSILKGLIPGFRGLVTTFYSGLISCYSASPKPWSYRVRRTAKGWDKGNVWYPEKCTIMLRDDASEIIGVEDEIKSKLPVEDLILLLMNENKNKNENEIELKPNINGIGNNKAPKQNEEEKKKEKEKKKIEEIKQKLAKLRAAVTNNIRNIHAMNPAHILFECATNRDWGRGLNWDEIDIESFKKVADTLFNEKFGLCFRYNRQDQLQTFIQQILDHIGAAQYADLSTGKLTLKLIRNDYDPEKLPLFNYDNGILSVQDDDSASNDATYNEIVVTYSNPVTHEDGTVRAQNLASIQQVGLISNSVEYKAVPTQELAARVAERDLEMNAAGITRLIIKFDRRGGILEPASCFRVSLPDRDIENMILRVGKIEEQNDGALLITGVQDVFSLSSTSYSTSQQTSEWVAPDNSIRAVNDVQLIELPYAVLVSTLSAADLDYVKPSSGYIGVMASAPTSASINYILQSRAMGTDFVTQSQGDWTPKATLINDIGKLTTKFEINSDCQPSIGEGILINDEFMRVDAIENNIITVGRGCLDSLPSSHKCGSKIRYYMNAIYQDNIEYLSGEKVQVRLLTQTNIGVLNQEIAPIESVVMSNRQIRPYLPGNIKINEVLYPDSIDEADNYVLTFSHRDRVLQADQLIDCLSDNIGPEDGTVYKIEIADYYTKEILWKFSTTDTFILLPYSSHEDYIYDDLHILTLYSIRDGYESLQKFVTTLPEGHITVESK
ncbi:hypothetical protein A9G35_03070 [Gilliamella sp. Choc5-1]|jgi:hypothetical protein|uniref:phage tail protein n=1 Tax=Gilliamella sp. Choc5-1 TaxID=3120238 RepID=UPI00080E0F6F|nr:phage tail protein [Gilliamella apicola]OCG47902.1 hypothetical protein A9G35_03070 [Gilliamella apicola]